MKIRNLLLLAIGIGIGYKLAAKMREDDPERGRRARVATRTAAERCAPSPRRPSAWATKPRRRAWI